MGLGQIGGDGEPVLGDQSAVQERVSAILSTPFSAPLTSTPPIALSVSLCLLTWHDRPLQSDKSFIKGL